MFLIILFPSYSICQTTGLTCKDVKYGVFYDYPKNSNMRVLIERTNEYDKEIDLDKKDTSYWKTVWKNDCEYVSSFISGTGNYDDQALSLLKKHKLVFKIETVTKDYYTYEGYIDKTSNIPFENDTIWLHPKINPSGNWLFTAIRNESEIRRAHFSDTSKYALLYIYRPKKFTNSLSDFPVYFDGNILCAMKNNSGYIFKIFKEGTFEIRSNLLNDKSATNLEVKFGKKYFIKSIIHWGIQTNLNNFKLRMTIMPSDVGYDEFESVDLNK